MVSDEVKLPFQHFRTISHRRRGGGGGGVGEREPKDMGYVPEWVILFYFFLFVFQKSNHNLLIAAMYKKEKKRNCTQRLYLILFSK
jgi:hypothetical protein